MAHLCAIRFSAPDWTAPSAVSGIGLPSIIRDQRTIRTSAPLRVDAPSQASQLRVAAQGCRTSAPSAPARREYDRAFDAGIRLSAPSQG